MHLSASCPRCPAEVATDWACPNHGGVEPLWRARETSYDALAEHLGHADGFPTYLPWPLLADWRVTDIGVVRGSGAARATVTGVAGWTDADGPVEFQLISEEPGTGLGARVAGTVHSDPGAQVASDLPALRIRLDEQQVALWTVPLPEGRGEGLERSVMAGEARGRWFWVVASPASAVMLLHRDWSVRDVSGLGGALLELPFGGPRPAW